MSIYENFPRGAMLINHTVTAQLPGDFVVGYMGAGLNRSAKFTAQIQVAADSKRPFLAFYANDPGQFLDQYQSLNLDHWKEADPLTNWLIKEAVNPSIMAGSAKRAIHGVILDMNNVSRKRADTGKVDEYPTGWILACAEYMIWAIWKLYRLPVWCYMNPDVADRLAARGSLESAQMAAFLQKNGISTYVDSMTPQGESVTALPYPPDSLQAKLRAACLPTLGNGAIDFVCYSTGDVQITGVAGGVVPLFLYQGSCAGLYDLLGWEDAPVVTPPPVVVPPPSTNTDTAAILSAIAEIKAEIEKLTEAVNSTKVTVSGDLTITRK